MTREAPVADSWASTSLPWTPWTVHVVTDNGSPSTSEAAKARPRARPSSPTPVRATRLDEVACPFSILGEVARHAGSSSRTDLGASPAAFVEHDSESEEPSVYLETPERPDRR